MTVRDRVPGLPYLTVVAILGSLLSPAFDASAWPGWITRPATLGELATCVWLLVRSPHRAAGGSIRADGSLARGRASADA